MTGSTQNRIYGNKIGIFTGNDISIKFPNNSNGIEILDTSNTRIGEGDNGLRNFIGGNQRSGIVVSGANSQQTAIRGNYIDGFFANRSRQRVKWRTGYKSGGTQHYRRT